MPGTRRHHYVPVCYLKQWATPPERHGRLFVFDRTTGGKPRPSTPNNEAHERYFNAVEVEGADTNVVEKDVLGKLENIFGPAISRVNEVRALVPETRRLLCAFIAIQAVRTPDARTWFDAGYSKMGMATLEAGLHDKSVFFAQGRTFDPPMTDDELQEAYEAARDFLQQPGARIEMDRTTLILTALQLAPHIEDVLKKRCWLLGMAPDDTPAITSDDPIVLEWTGNGSPPATWSPGFGDHNTVVLAAVGPRHIVAGVPEEVRGKRRVQLSREDVARFNTMVAVRASRFVYSVGPSFAFWQDGTVVDGPNEWLNRVDGDPRGRKKRGELKLTSGWLGKHELR